MAHAESARTECDRPAIEGCVPYQEVTGRTEFGESEKQ